MSELDVFINCPFDEEYKPLFEAIHFTISASGYLPRCALEEEDGLDLRLAKLCRIVGDCPRSIHDLSRTELNAEDLPRFNMPFELGLTMGAKIFGGAKHKDKKALVMVAEPYRMPSYLSDLGGNDPSAHGRRVDRVIVLVRRFLHDRPYGAPLPGPGRIDTALKEFQAKLPEMANAIDHSESEICSLQDYRTYSHLVAAYLSNYPVV